jgi:hypothetical protein
LKLTNNALIRHDLKLHRLLFGMSSEMSKFHACLLLLYSIINGLYVSSQIYINYLILSSLFYDFILK